MDDSPVSVEVVLKTGQKFSFAAFEFKKTPEGWEFVSYPEQRGFESVQVVKGDSVAAIKITAPSQFFRAAAAVTHASPEVASPMPATSPQTYTASKANKSIPIPTKDGRPKAVVPVYDKDGNEGQMEIGASMVG